MALRLWEVAKLKTHSFIALTGLANGNNYELEIFKLREFLASKKDTLHKKLVSNLHLLYAYDPINGDLSKNVYTLLTRLHDFV